MVPKDEAKAVCVLAGEVVAALLVILDQVSVTTDVRTRDLYSEETESKGTCKGGAFIALLLAELGI